MIIALDAMGGDNAPLEIVKGAIDALKENKDITVVLIGDEPQIRAIIDESGYGYDRIKIVHTTEVITNEEIPTKAIKNKKDSSIVVGFNMLKRKEVDCFLSAGSSGALLAGGVLIIGRIKGVDRPAVASVFPTKHGKILLLDSGFNTNIKPNNYVQFGILGSAYMKTAFGVENPRVGLINIGVEEEKGGDVEREAYQLMKQCEHINFIGNLESRDVFSDVADVAVTDGFTGNVMLKALEGATTFFFGEVKSVFTKNIFTKLNYLFLKNHLKEMKYKLDPDVLGGAPMLGVDGLVVKSHGSSKAKTIKYAILRANTLAESRFVEAVSQEISVVSSKEETKVL